MRRSISAIATTAALVASVALTGTAANAGESISAGGSSFANAIITACAASYSKDTITYSSSGGSGTGRSSFLNGTYQFGASDAPYAAADKKPENFTYVPLLGGPIGVIYNLDGYNSLKLSAKVLGGIFNGRYTTWDDAEIAKLNPGVKLPSQKINVVYRSGSSGTTQNFANFLRGNGASGYKDSGTWATASSQGSPTGVGVGTGALVVSEIAKSKYSIGYADLADTAGKGLETAAIRNPLGEFVKPTVAAAAKFLSAQKVSENGILEIDYKKSIKGGYNASLVTYALAPTANNTAKGVAVRNFLTYVIKTCAPAKAAGLNYTPLAGALKTKALKLVATVK